MHKKRYLQKLELALSSNGWDILEVIDEIEWYAKGHWKIRSVRDNFGLELFVSFMVWPEDYDKKVTDMIYASTKKPTYFHPVVETIVSQISMTKGLYNEELKNFLDEINKYRKKAK